MSNRSLFWDRIAKRYARQPVADEASYQQKLAKTREYLRPDMELLEFGCGTGSTALVHAPQVREIVAIDISRKMIQIARDKAAAAGIGNVDFRQAGFDTFDPDGRRFDMVLGLSILHLVEDRDVAIGRVYELLKPGGLFVSSTACIGSMPGPIARLIPLLLPLGRPLGLLPQLRIFTDNELRESLTTAGFAIEHDWQPAADKALFLIMRKPD